MKLLKHSACAMLLLMFANPSPILAHRSDPNNAALLYYQAFISLPDNFNEISMPLDPSPAGIIDPNQTIRDYLKGFHNAFEFTKAAAEIPKCDWGLRHSLGDSVPMPHLMLMRLLTLHIVAETQVHAADREFQEALENCLVMHKIAQHVDDEDLWTCLVSRAIHAKANKGIGETLSLMPPDEPTLVWLESELAKVPQRPSLNNALVIEEQIALRKLDLDKDKLIQTAKTMCGGILDPKREEVLRKADLDFLEASRQYFVQSMAALRRAFEDTTPFETKHKQIRYLDEKTASDEKTNPHAVFAGIFRGNWARTYAVHTIAQSSDNKLKVAIHLYRMKAQTGLLPKNLPEGLPKNPFTGEDFGYEKTEDGFILRTETIGLGRDKPRESLFRVQ